MIAVIFEVTPAEGQREDYLAIAATLRADLEAIEGFVSVERFQSLTNPEKVLSLSFFEDEAAVMAWRRTARHRAAQEAGRGGVFADYRLRVTHVLRDYGMTDRAEAPDDSRAHHDALAHS
jgi:heme-degrading monooxygenase HmoA